jgi:hypothetical protein
MNGRDQAGGADSLGGEGLIMVASSRLFASGQTGCVGRSVHLIELQQMAFQAFGRVGGAKRNPPI